MITIKHNGIKWQVIRKGKVKGEYTSLVKARLASMTMVYKD